jgi:hypothetical protein
VETVDLGVALVMERIVEALAIHLLPAHHKATTAAARRAQVILILLVQAGVALHKQEQA